MDRFTDANELLHRLVLQLLYGLLLLSLEIVWREGIL